MENKYKGEKTREYEYGPGKEYETLEAAIEGMEDRKRKIIAALGPILQIELAQININRERKTVKLFIPAKNEI